MREWDNPSKRGQREPRKIRLLQEIAAIPAMDRGKLSDYYFKGRSGVSSPCHKLQYLQDSKTYSRYVPEAELPAVAAAQAGHTLFRLLVQQYADLVIKETYQNIASVRKKPVRPESCEPRKRKSNN